MRVKVCGIYLIRNPKGRVYIGQSTDVYERWKAYRRFGCPHQTSLLASLRKYGAKKHKFELLCQCEKDELNDKEAYYVALFQSTDRRYGMNLKEGGGVRAKVSEETRERMSRANMGRNKGRKPSPEAVEKMRQTKLAQHVKVSDEMKKRISEKMKGRKQTEEHIRNAVNARRGKKRKPLTEEHKRKIAEGNKGKRLSAESIRKRTLARKGKPSALKGRAFTEEHKENLKKALKNRIMPEGFGKRLSKVKKGIPWSKARRESQNKRRYKYERVLLPDNTRAA